MSKDPKKTRSTQNVSPQSGGESSEGAQKIPARKLWAFRLLAVVGAPVVFLALLELSLRIMGWGYSTHFLIHTYRNGRDLLVQNNQFGWRFFGPKLARLPVPVCISQHKTPDTIRIFVLGESAAKGEPQPAFGFPRMLQTMLQLRYPGTRFEVVNAAMTAINSHAILPIARDCASAEGDIWVIYMGNNEVVGPFGAGTIFGREIPPLPIIRGSLALQTTRSGQLLDSLLGSFKRSAAQDEWHGMQMFLDQQVKADSPGLHRVYQNFERNLQDIIETGRSHGVGIVVSTVAVNLLDCAPFGSAHRAGLSETEMTNWTNAFQLGVQAQETGKYTDAEQRYSEAAKIDPTYAELRFRQGMCGMMTGNHEAREDFVAARNLDTLRFRCDSRLNEITRHVVTNRSSERILLVDSERAFEHRSMSGVPGGDLFYEHVHLNFSGNYFLAKTIAEEVKKLLPQSIVTAKGALEAWPSQTDCVRSLGWSEYSWLMVMREILARVSAPPFTAQANHEMQVNLLKGSMDQSARALQAAGISAASNACEIALKSAPDDPVLLGQLSYFKKAAGDSEGAAALARHELEILPTDSLGWQRLGLILVGQQKIGEAADSFSRAIELDSADVLSLQNLGQCLWLTGRKEEAIAKYRRAVKLQPNFAIGWLSLGTVLEETGRNAEAEECYQKAVACQSSRETDLVALARFCRSRQRPDAAATNYDKATKLNPEDSSLHIEAGEFFLAGGHLQEAEDQLAEALRLTPNSARARQLYGAVFGRAGMSVEAEQQFREALKLDPELLEARLNLGIALMTQGKSDEALGCFKAVLDKDPANQLALKYIQNVRGGSHSQSQK